MKIIKLFVLCMVFFCFSLPISAQQRNISRKLTVGDAVVTGFSGTLAPDPAKPLPPGKSALDLTLLDPDGPSAEIIDISRPGRAWDASLLGAPKILRVPASQVGQVFGVAIGEPSTPDASPNIYLSATSAYGLHIVRRGNGGTVERLKAGGPGAQWANGQFGLALQGGPGSIYVVDGTSGTASLLANIMLDGVPNPGPGLGNLAYDATHKQIFVSDLYTGMIHRIGLDGADLGRFDHGVTARTAARLAPVPFDVRSRLNITHAAFNVDSPETWGLSPPPRRVWAVTLHEGRLYYSVQEGLQVWSVGIQKDGDFASDMRFEAAMPGVAGVATGSLALTDIAFSRQGAMVVAQRAAFGTGNYAYSAFTNSAEPRVLRFWPRKPTDPPAPDLWRAESEDIAVGLAGTMRNANGGVAFGYGYDRNNTLTTGACAQTLLITGERLRLDPSQRERLSPGGQLPVDGVQISPFDALRPADKSQLLTGYFVDYDDKFIEGKAFAGRMGSVRTYAMPCQPGEGEARSPGRSGLVAGGMASGTGAATGAGTAGGAGTATGPEGCIGPSCPPPACMTVSGSVKCNTAGGGWVYEFSVVGATHADVVQAMALTPGISITSSPVVSLLPAPSRLSLAASPGQSAMLELCAFDKSAAESGKPYDCCRLKVPLSIPDQSCRPAR